MKNLGKKTFSLTRGGINSDAGRHPRFHVKTPDWIKNLRAKWSTGFRGRTSQGGVSKPSPFHPRGPTPKNNKYRLGGAPPGFLIPPSSYEMSFMDKWRLRRQKHKYRPRRNFFTEFRSKKIIILGKYFNSH